MENTNNELRHYGVPGMKWGVKRSYGELKVDRKKRDLNSLNNNKRIAENASSAFRSMADIAGKGANSRKPSKKVKNELSKMSDQELRNRINRMNMEQQYASLNPSRKARGAAFARSALEVAGSVAAIAGSAVGIAFAMRQMKG